MGKRLTPPRIDIHAACDPGRDGSYQPFAILNAELQDVGVPVVRIKHDSCERLGSPYIDHAFHGNRVG